MAATSGFAGFRAWINEGAGRWLAVLAGLGLTAGAVAVFVIRRGSEAEKRERILAAGRTCVFVCTNPSCGARGELKAEYFSKWPQVCPKCQQPTAARGIRCTRCGRIILDNRQRIVRCPSCGHVLDRRGTPMDDPLPPPERFRK
jgi:DNA-directed RNA polymerase subunit RPC12/RpoP